MSKIIRAINTMILNKDKITNIISKEGQLFFLYDNKYKWSIGVSGGYFYLCYYPDDLPTIKELSMIPDMSGYEYLRYSLKDFKTQEAEESFRELYTIIKEKRYDMDKVLDDIINEDVEPI